MRFISKRRFAGNKLTLGLSLLLLIAAGILGWQTRWLCQSIDETKELSRLQAEGTSLGGTILRLDEVLTMSCLMGAHTGDPVWETKYREHEPQLRDAIERARFIGSQVLRAEMAEMTDTSNDALIRLENQAFDCVREGRLADAQHVLNSETYARHKDAYHQGMEQFLRGLEGETGAKLDDIASAGVWRLSALCAALLLAVGLCIAGVTRDANAIKAASEELSRFKSTLDRTNDCVFMFRPDTLKFVYCNSGATKQVGYSHNELMSMRPIEIKPQLNERQFREFVQPLIDGHEDFLSFETVHRHKDGHDIPVEIFLQYIAPAGEPARFVAIVRDVSEWKRVEKQLLDAKGQAEEGNLAKSQFLASMSHELRTPLNGVIGMADLLARTELTEKQQQFVNACRNSGEVLLQLINDILDFSKIEAGRLELDLHDFDLEKLVTDIVDTMTWRVVEKSLEMPCYIDQTAQLVLKGDSGRLRQVLVNLLGNAIKFTEAGEVVVRTTTVDRRDDRVTVRFSISDTGIGIPADKRDRLFQSFSQVDASTTRHYGGTGLGLAISQSLVELMGGTIGVESEAGEGSTFWLDVPFAVVSDADNDDADQAKLAGLRALIVDDNETNRTILAEYAADWGIDTVTTSSVDEALAAVERAKAAGSTFHVVLTDYNMPRRNGLDLSRALKQQTQSTVLLLGSTDISLNPTEAQEHGIDAILRKPLRRHELYDVLCGVLVSPAALPKSIGKESLAKNQEAHLCGHILLAEDNSINSMYMVELLEQLGCTCDAVTDGKQAAQAVRERRYDLVLMDCQMPEMDGFEATRQIRQWESDESAESRLPIIALTANAVKGDREDVPASRVLGESVRVQFGTRHTPQGAALTFVL